MTPAEDLLSALQTMELPPEVGRPLSLDELPGEVDDNYRLGSENGGTFLVKVCRPGGFDPTPLLDHLAGKPIRLHLPRVLLVRDGFPTPSGPGVLRIHSWVPGRPVADLHPRTPALRRSWGRACGLLSRHLSDLDLPAARRAYKWDPLQAGAARPLLEYLGEDERELAARFLDRLEELSCATLPRQVNYNDAHESNLLTEEGRVTGVIDFGDAVVTATVCEVAIACAYAGMGTADPLGAMREVVAGYCEIRPLLPAEADALCTLIGARLVLTVTAAAENRQRHPENAYLTVSETTAWTLLRYLRSVAPAFATAALRDAAGLPAHPLRETYLEWAATAQPFPVMDVSGRLIPLDLSVGSPVLGLNRNFEELPRFVRRLRRHLEDKGADIGVGGYGEVRPVYTTDDFQSEGNAGPRWRSVHLGLDFWTRRAGDTVFAPLDGRVYVSGVDPTTGGYGAVIILEHTPRPDLCFYTLYGHLSADSIADAPAGTQVQGGQAIATLGGTEENGGWPPHLHFQVMLDLLDNWADFPGVAYPEERDIWLGICPDPRTLLPHHVPREIPAPPANDELLDQRKRVLGYGLSVSYASPLQVLRGAGQYLYDATGRRYLDTVNNVAHVGHEHPRVVEAISRQSAVLNTNSRYLHPGVLQLAAELTGLLPEPLSVVHFVNSGSEANELALRMAEAVTGNRQVLALEMGYHGNTSRTVDVSSYKFDRRGGGGRPAETDLLPLPDTLRGLHLHPPLPDRGAVAFIAESIVSCGGQLMLPAGYLRRVYDHVRGAGGVTIADEVQTGLGRVGSRAWAFELQGVIPDIVTVGKPFGNGHPLAAVVCTPAVAEAFANGMEYFNTFGGNPVSAAAGLAVLGVLRDEDLQARAHATGTYLTGLLNQLRDEEPLIADVRGAGLFLGFELAGTDLAPATAPAAYLKNRMRELGILMSTDGPHENVLKIKPPLCFGRRDADRLAESLRRVFREDGMRRY
ncbi:aminotransferase class III-fold pyridoxal phosphate-dependent enzyme [Lewinella sp. IMCC34183]|uniref:aminotransferase class III-fold pyridoxal phosphate-dependent enzyme n=1 Tax=Lewinella sp. IMCC34183 TaxID=2248762 RepID=UPI000E27819A|nr:aminotransferase class III-fold pyridoxal phosphate-dependent enzyme [Lewinella sp. IMCC34183]